jgi:methylthioribose-1-phosphate isomerase
MRVGDRWYRTVWLADDGWTVSIIDQTALPGAFVTADLTTVDEVVSNWRGPGRRRSTSPGR